MPAKTLKRFYLKIHMSFLLEGTHINDHLDVNQKPIEVVNWEIEKLRRSDAPIVMIHWKSNHGPRYTWERKIQMKQKNPHLYLKDVPSMRSFEQISGRNSFKEGRMWQLPELRHWNVILEQLGRTHETNLDL